MKTFEEIHLEEMTKYVENEVDHPIELKPHVIRMMANLDKGFGIATGRAMKKIHDQAVDMCAEYFDTTDCKFGIPEHSINKVKGMLL